MEEQLHMDVPGVEDDGVAGDAGKNTLKGNLFRQIVCRNADRSDSFFLLKIRAASRRPVRSQVRNRFFGFHDVQDHLSQSPLD